MARNLIGPWVVDIFYVVNTLEHRMRLNCDMASGGEAGDPFSEFQVKLRSGGQTPLNTAVDAWVALIKTQFGTTVNITIANLYYVPPDTEETQFRSTYNINLLGTNGSAPSLTHQSTLTFTTQLGGPFRIAFMEDSVTTQTRVPIRDASAPVQAIATYLSGSTNWIIARDGSYPVGWLNYSGNVNDSLERRRYRTS